MEINEFGTFSVDVGSGRLQKVLLLRCSVCDKYVTTEGYEISPESIVSREGISRSNMRTITALLNNGIYQELEELFAKETNNGTDSSKIMNEIIALGLKEYRRTLS